FEDVFPQISRRFVQNGAQFLVNITNDGWYGASAAPFQHAQASVFRAVENRVPVVRCANTGLSEFIDKNGRITSGMKPFSAGYKTENISINPANSSSLQGIFVVISFLLSFCGFGIIFLRH
ncbi:MAG: apolipoprotein N-acyltransferase, partial [Candidatus Omnitrophica bacterium CG_4_10_14_0_8_um_filter_43_18]